MNGTATDDGWPFGSTLTTTWTKVSGPGTVTFANAASPVTTAQFSIEGTYVLRLTANDSRFTVSDECTVTVLPANTPPIVNAGPDQTLTFLQAATLNGTATDDGLPVGSVVESIWTQVSGPGTVTFANPTSLTSGATFSAPGTYVLRLAADDTQFTAQDELTITVNPVPHASRVYTLSNDFTQGSLINLTTSTPDQLQLDSTIRSFKFMWVAVSSKGTVVKINTETGQIIGEYFTSPNGQPRDPSRTTVDQNGNVWATNRAGNSVVHIGLVENGQCVDRNSNGVIDTSTGFNNIRPWTNLNNANTNGGVSTAQDECILHYTRVNSFGTRHVAVNTDNDIWVSGTSGQRFDLLDGVTGAIKRSENSVGFGGYGGLIDRNGVIWSANPMLRWDTSKPLNGPNGVNWRGYSHPSYGLCIDSLGNVYNTSFGNGTVRKFSPDGTLIASFNQGSPFAQGCVVDRNDDIWVAHSLNTNSVGHIKSSGVYVGTITVGSGPTGVAVDGDGRIWATNFNSRTVSRINPALGPIGGDGVTRVGAVDFTTVDLGGNPYNYSDMTGSTLTGAPDTGTWTTVFDSQIAGAQWGRIGWTSQVCSDGLITVSIATSENNTTFSTPVVVANGDDPVVPNGRFVRISVRFDRATTGETPILYDLSIGTVGFPLDTPANVAPGVDAGADKTLDGILQTTLSASVCDDGLPSNQKLAMTWSKVSGPGTVTFAKPNSSNTNVTFSALGTYTLRFTASDSIHTTSDTLVVTVLPGNQAPVANAGPNVTVDSCNATLNGTVTDDGKPTNGTLLITWNKLSGPGIVTFGSPNSASTSVTFTKAGVYVLRLSAGDGALGHSDDVIVTVRASGAPLYYELTQYLSQDDSPFRNLNSTYFHLDNFEDHLLNVPGVTANTGGVTSIAFGPTNHDSVDADDGLINGTGLTGDSYFSANGATGIRFTFNAAVLGSLPTHAGLVWTDGAGTVTFEAFDSQGVSMGVRGPFNLADASFSGQTAEDRFFGVYNRGGISAIKIANANQAIEVDHLQYAFELSDNNAPSVSAGDDQAIYLPENSVTLSGSAVDDGLPACGGSLTFAWSKVSGPGTVTFAPANAAVTTATFSTPGVYVLRLTASDSELSGSDEVTVRFNQENQAPVVSAGPDLTIPLNGTAALNGSVTDDGLPINATVITTWSMVSGPGLVTFAQPTDHITTATFSEAGVYVLRLTATDSALSAFDETVVTVTPPNRAPLVNAGADLSITLPGTARLNGTVTDDGLPIGSTVTVSWTQVSGPGTTTFANAAAAVTTATFSEAGTYVLRLSASDTELTGTDDLTVTVNPPAPNQAPVVDAGANQSTELKTNRIQNAGNDEPLVNGEIRAWTEAVGTTWTRAASGANGFPESVNGGHFFYAGETASAELRQDIDLTSFAGTIAAGTQAFELKAFVRSRAETTPDTTRLIIEYRNTANTTMIARLDSGEMSSTTAWQLVEDTRVAPAGTGWIRIRLIATRRTGTTNDAYFDALSLRAVTGAGVKLNGSITDDGLPAGGSLTATWSKVSGPGDVVFANANAASTSATFSEAGVYVLRLTANDSELSSSDEVTITVEAANLAPVVNAGPDQTVTLPNSATLSGSVTDDGKPVGATVTSTWSKVSGPGTVTFANAAAPSTSATFSIEGTYVLRLAADDTDYISIDTITIVVNPIPPNQAPVVNAGADQVINPPATTATLSGTVTDDGLPPNVSLTYQWTKVSGPGNVNFSSPTALTTNATFSEAGAYVLRLTANDSELSGSDDVRVTLNGTNKAPTVNAGADQTVAHPNTVNLIGTANDDGLPVDSSLSFSWTKLSGPGTATFANASALQTTATFSVPGTYVLRLTTSDSALSASDDVTITQTAPPTAGLNSPADGSTITGRTNFIGTVSEGSTWRLEYSLNEEGVAPTWITLNSGNTPVTNGTLGTFDPTVLLNGIYSVRLVATNGSGQTTTTSVTTVVDGGQKVGNFSVSFTDLNVPVGGIPIEVLRTYDTRDKRKGDFGVGWTLDVRNFRLQESGDVGEGWQGTVTSGFFPSYCVQPTRPHIVTISLPGGKVYKFEATLSPQCSTLFPLRETTVGFRPLPGTQASLAPVDDPTVLVAANFPGAADLLDYSTLEHKDFDQYLLTLPNGTSLLIDQRDGLKQMRDPNNNTLTVTSAGITHSSGKSVTFTRDAQNRITRVTDPLGKALDYAYDANGDLVSVTDQERNVTRFTYDQTHRLLDIIDPRGVRAVRNEYDADGRLTAIIDPQGRRMEVAHDLNLRREVVRDRLGNITISEYDTRGNIVRQTDAAGHSVISTYDSRSNRVSETNELGQTTTFSFDAGGNVLAETDPLGNRTSFTYNSLNQPLTVTDARGKVTAYTYDAKGNLLTSRDSLGNTVTHTYDARGNRTSSVDTLGKTYTYVYDSEGRMTRQTHPTGESVTFTYDANGNKTSETLAYTNAQGVAVTQTTSYAYDGLNCLVLVTDPVGNTVATQYDVNGNQLVNVSNTGQQLRHEYDDAGNLLKTIYPDGSTETHTYDANGNQTSTTDRAGHVTRFEYDALNRHTRTVHPDGTSIRREYDAASRIVATYDENGNKTTHVYDAANRRTKVIDALGNETTFGYDAGGNRTSVTDANNHTTRFEYDNNNNLTKVIFNDGTFDLYTYDALGRKTSATDQSGVTTRFEYDEASRLTKLTNALNQVTSFAYDGLGNRVSQTDALGRVTRFEYDNARRLTKRTLPLGMSETYAYDAKGNITSKTDFKGNSISFAYNVNGQLATKTYPDGSQVLYTYTLGGLRKTVQDARGVTTYAHDQRNRPTSVTNPDGAIISYAYDARGNRTSVTAPSGTTTYTYDPLNRLSTVRDPQGGDTTYAYDAVGNRRSVRYPNGAVTQYAYNTLNRLTLLENKKADLSLISSYEYTLGARGNRLGVTEHTGRQVNYSYDALYRITREEINDPASGAASFAYTYDAVGNRLTKSVNGGPAINHTYDANDRLLTEGATAYTYDNNGNVLTKALGGATVNYAWDFDNRLTGVTGPGQAVTYGYDADSIRVRSTAGSVVTNYLVDKNREHSQVLEERNGAGALAVSYVHGDDLISQRRGNVSSFYHYDGLGSTRQLTDDAGAVTDAYTYEAFGNLLAATGATPNSFLFTGEQYDPNVGFYYLRARHYDPSVGRFISADPFAGNIFEPASLHKYLYANLDPVNNTDPSGLFSVAEMNMVSNIIGRLASIAFRVLNALDKVMTLVDVINAVVTVFNFAMNPAAIADLTSLFTNVSSGLPDITNGSFWSGEVAPAVRANLGRIVQEVTINHPQKGIDLLRYVKMPNSAFVIYMPTPPAPLPNPGGLIPTGISLRGKPVKLFLGKGGWRGRLLGVGVIPSAGSQSGDFQIFRMDYHPVHPGMHTGDYAHWPYDRFHFHVPK